MCNWAEGTLLWFIIQVQVPGIKVNDALINELSLIEAVLQVMSV